METTREQLIDFFKNELKEQLSNSLKIKNMTMTSDFYGESNLDIMQAVMNKKYINNHIYVLWSHYRITLEMYSSNIKFNKYLYTYMGNFIYKFRSYGQDRNKYFFNLSDIYEMSEEQVGRLSVAEILGGINQEDLHNICEELEPLGYRK